MTNDDRKAPCDLDAEEAVLGSLLIDSCIEKVTWLKAEDFSREKNRWTYEAMLELHKRHEAINQITVAYELAKGQKLEAAGGAAYLSHVISQTPTSVHLEHYAAIVKKCSQKCCLIRAANQIAELGYDSLEPEEAQLKAEEILGKLREGNCRSKVISPAEQWEHAVKRYGRLRTVPGAKFNFGLPWLDQRTGGARAENLILLGARPGVGKTTLLWQFAESAAAYGNVLFVSAEMSEAEIQDRRVARESGLSIPVVAAGGYSEEIYDRVYEGLQSIPASQIYLCDIKSLTTGDIRAAAKDMMIRHGLVGVFIDYLQLLRDRYGTKLYERVSYISAELKDMARQLGLPVVVACQLNRATEQGDKQPQLHELRESGALEQDADLVLLLYRADAYVGFKDAECPAGQAHLIIAKQRQGGKPGRKRLIWLSSSQRYGELRIE